MISDTSQPELPVVSPCPSVCVPIRILYECENTLPVPSCGHSCFSILPCTRRWGRRPQPLSPHQALPAPAPGGLLSPRPPHAGRAGEPRRVPRAAPRRDRPPHPPHSAIPSRPVPRGSPEENRPPPAGRRGPGAAGASQRERRGSAGGARRGEAPRLSPPPAVGALPSLPARRRRGRAWSWRESIKSRRETRPPSCRSRREGLRRGAGARQPHHDQPQLLPVGLRRRQR